MPSKTVVILGGGVGGMIAANRLRERLTADHRVVLVERDVEQAFAPSFLWLMTGDRKPHQVRRPVADLLRRGVECIHANAEALDLTNEESVHEYRRDLFRLPHRGRRRGTGAGCNSRFGGSFSNVLHI